MRPASVRRTKSPAAGPSVALAPARRATSGPLPPTSSARSAAARLSMRGVRVEDGLLLSDVRARIKKLKSQVEVLKGVPIPAPNIREKVRAYVERLPLPSIGGIGVGEALTVQWPT